MRGNTLSLQTTTDFYIEECCACGVTFAMPMGFYKERQRDKQSWFCPNGHSQSYVGKSDAQLRREAEARATAAEDQMRAAQRERDRIERQLADAHAEAARLAKRAKAGVCPCCKRSFVQLKRHMDSKHPDYADA